MKVTPKNISVVLIAAASIVSFLFLDTSKALIFGLVCALAIPVIPAASIQKFVKKLLPICVVGLGFGMDFGAVIRAGAQGIVFTSFTIFATLGIGVLIAKLLKIDKITGYLISVGTAICGGSAIAAVAPAINAKNDQIGVSLGIVFLLNAIALLIFPPIGHYLNLSDHSFGVWAAIAIHDTSSVVGAATNFSDQALAIAAPIKLARALWIVPLVWISLRLFQSAEDKDTSIRFPWFILYFLLASVVGTFFADFREIWDVLYAYSKQGLSLTLFLIGLGLSVKVLKQTGFRPLILAVLLWFVVAIGSLLVIIL